MINNIILSKIKVGNSDRAFCCGINIKQYLNIYSTLKQTILKL